MKTMMKKVSIAYYVSSHGYGHGVRSTDILRSLASLYPNIAITVITDLPVPFLKNRLQSFDVGFRRGSFDAGMAQLDSIRVDLDATFHKVKDLYARHHALLDAEKNFLQEGEFDMVVADIPAIPIEAAAAVDLPRVAIGNFAWDWIYEEFAERDSRWLPFVDQFSKGYAKADLLLRLPFAEEMRAFPRKIDIPLLASPGHERRREISEMTGASSEKRWVLLSFTTLDWDDAALRKVEQLTDYEFFTVQPLEWRRGNIHPVNREQISFSDVLASVDAVISKPGFGLLSECVVNRKPILYADRVNFREYAVLEREMPKYLKCAHLDTKKLYRGELANGLESVFRASDPPETLASGGAEIAARHILSFLRIIIS